MSPRLDSLAIWAVSCLLVGLRVGPVFAFATPFALTHMPRLYRMLFGLGLGICVMANLPPHPAIDSLAPSALFLAACKELMLGATIALAFQIVFAALQFAGRTLDIQAGIGFAVLVDPATRSQSPLTGTLFAYAAAAVFFATDGHLELLRLFGASFDAIPLGAWSMPRSPERMAAFMSLAFFVALGVAGTAILALFVVDVIVALLSRSVPQMNVLILGFQAKTIVFLLVLPFSFGVSGTLFARLMTMTLQAIPRLL